MNDPKLRAELTKIASTRRVAAPEEINNYYVSSAGWMSMLACRMYSSGLPPDIEAMLDHVELLTVLQDMASETIKYRNKKKRPNEVPAAVHHFEKVCQHLQVPHTGVTDVQHGLTLNDMDAIFLKRFPLAEVIDHGDFWKYLEADLDKASRILKFIFSMENKA